MAPTDEVAVLYQLLDGTTPAALTWVHAPEPDHRENLQVECSRENTFAAWLNRRAHDGNIWHLAMAWQFYRDWVCGFCTDHWRGRLTRRFPPDPFLDQLLAPTHGWLLWSFQVELLVHSAVADVEGAQHLAKLWRVLHPEREAALDGITLPNGTPLWDALCERSPRLRDGTPLSGGRPEMPLAALLHACLARPSAGS
ncbi:MAG: hypothetical protein U1F22_11645 [Lysobacterales bacterium]